MTVEKKTLIGTVDLKPTWAEQAVKCVHIIQNAAFPEETRETAAKELIRMGRLLDQYNRATNDLS